MSNGRVRISSELLNAVIKDVSKHIRKKLRAMEIDVTELELHNSSLTRTLRCYVTLSRTTNLKALYLAEQMVCKELQEAFALHPHAFYWRYLPEAKTPDATPAENEPAP